MSDLFAPPTDEELDLYAPPKPDEVKSTATAAADDDLYAPPADGELMAPPTAAELPAPGPALEPTGRAGMLTDDNLRSIAAKHGVAYEDLKSAAPYFGAQREPEGLIDSLSEGAKQTAGTAGRMIGLGAPQFIYKKMQEPNMRRALDELTEIAGGQQGSAQKISEAIGGPASYLAKTAGAIPRIVEAAGTGTAVNTFESKEGQELEAAKQGAKWGAGLGVFGEVFGKLLSKSGAATKVEQELAQNTAKSREFDIEAGTQDVARRTEQSEKVLEDVTFNKRDTITNAETDALVKEQFGDETLAKYLDPTTTEGQQIRRVVSDQRPSDVAGVGVEQAIKHQLADDILETRVRDFAEELMGNRPPSFDAAVESIEEVAKRQGADAIRTKYQDFVKLQQAEKFIGETGVRSLNEPNFFSKTANYISDNQFVLRHIDDKFGTRTEEMIRQMNKDYNRSTFPLGEFRNRQHEVFVANKKAGTDDAVLNSTKIYDAMDNGDFSGLSKAELETVGRFKQYFDSMLGFVNGLVREKDPRIAPLSIPKLENYVPKLMRPTAETVSVVERKIDKAVLEMEGLVGRKITDLSQLSKDEFRTVLQHPDIDELVRTVNMWDAKAVRDGADLSNRLKAMLYTRDGKVALETAARAAFERTGKVPDYLLEKNLYKLADMYTANTLRHLYLRDTIDKLRYEAKKLRKAGADVDADYVENLIRDIMGVRKGTAAEAFLQTKIGAIRQLDKMIDKYGKDSVQGGMLTAAKAFPEVLNTLSRQIYPNILGYFNLRAAVQNSTSIFTKLAPELGGAYGAAATIKGAARTLLNMRKYLRQVEAMGNIPAEFTRKGEQAIAEGIRRSSAYQIPAAALEGMGRAGMKLYQDVESFNRALVMGTAEQMAMDIARGRASALGSLKKFPYAIRKSVLEQRGNQQATAEILSKYLNDVTQYNYNRISLSEFGRTLGPIFSTFSKWPTATVGDVLYEMRSQGAFKSMPRNFEKYLAPLILLQSIDMLLGESLTFDDSPIPGVDKIESDRIKKIVGANGLSQSAPVGAITSVLTGEIFTPPAIDAIVDGVLVPALSGDGEKLDRGSRSLGNSFLPFAGLYRLLTEDIVTYATGTKPEK